MFCRVTASLNVNGGVILNSSGTEAKIATQLWIFWAYVRVVKCVVPVFICHYTFEHDRPSRRPLFVEVRRLIATSIKLINFCQKLENQ
jgi:hypothetical protein